MTPSQALIFLRQVARMPGHAFWGEPAAGLLGGDVDDLFSQMTSHNHESDGYLVHVAKGHGGKLATFDRPLFSRFGQDHVELIVP